jgi:hypothetical protein
MIQDPNQSEFVRQKMREYIGLTPMYSPELVAAIADKVETYAEQIQANGLLDRWRRNYAMVHNMNPDADGYNEDSFTVTGNNGELVEIKANEIRSLLKVIANFTLQNPAELSSTATNDETDSLLAAQAFDDVLHDYMQNWRNALVQEVLNDMLWFALTMDDGHIHCPWDPQVGQPYVADENGTVLREGDLSVKAKSNLDVVVDLNAENEYERDWKCVRDYINKYELSARFPDHAEAVLRVASKIETDRSSVGGWTYQMGAKDETDLVPVWHFYHRKTLLVPDGRYAMVVLGGAGNAQGVVLVDGPLPYADIPLITLQAGKSLGTMIGYCPANDLAPLCQAFNTLFSVVLTNQLAFGVQSIVYEEGSLQSGVVDLTKGMRAIPVTPGTKMLPQALQLTNTPAEIFNTLDLLRKTGETHSGANSVVRGDPEASLKSGRALNIVQAMAVQFNSSLQASFARAIKNLGNLMLKHFQQFVSTQRMTSVIGKNKINRVRKWDGSLFRQVAAVEAQIVNPLLKTLPGRVEAAQDMLKQGWLQNPQQYLTVLETGSLEPLTRGPMAENNLVNQENDELLEGRPVQALEFDNHPLHIGEHASLLASPMVRRNSDRVSLILAHIQEHKDLMAMQQQPQMPMPAQGDASGTIQPAQGEMTMAGGPQPGSPEPFAEAEPPPMDMGGETTEAGF